MAQVTVIVNNRNYTLACDDGEEDHLSELAAQIDNRIAELAPDVGQADDARLLLMAGLTLADDLTLAHERIAEVEEELAGLKDDSLKPAATPKAKHVNGATFDEDKFAGILETAARRMEDIAGRLG
jgi:cell division protein ZapA